MIERLRLDTGEQRDAYGRELLDRIFLQPSPFFELLKDSGIRIAALDPLGVASMTSLDMEMELGTSLPRDDRRRVASEMTDVLRKDDFHFGRNSTTEMKNGQVQIVAKTDGEARSNKQTKGQIKDQPDSQADSEKILKTLLFFYASTLSLEQAQARYLAYHKLLEEEVREKREARLAEQERAEAAQRERRELAKAVMRGGADARRHTGIPSTAHLVLYAAYDSDDFEAKVRGLKKTTERGVRIEALAPDFSGFPDYSASVLHRADVARILKSGLTSEEFEGLLPGMRQAIMKATENIEHLADNTAKEILDAALKRISIPKSKYILPFIAPRIMAAPIRRSITELKEEERITGRDETPTAFNSGSMPYPALLVDLWNLRFDPTELETEVGEFGAGNMAEKLRLLLSSGDRAVLLRDLKRKREVNLEGEIVKRAEMESFLGVKLLDDNLLTRVIFADVIGELRPLPYLVTGYGREVGLLSLRMVAEQFVIPEIISFLTPPSASKGIDKTIAGTVLEAVIAKVPQVAPNSRDYRQGSGAQGYIEARARYQKSAYKAHLKPPDPNDYKGGDKSQAFLERNGSYRAWRLLKPETQEGGKQGEALATLIKGRDFTTEGKAIPLINRRLLT